MMRVLLIIFDNTENRLEPKPGSNGTDNFTWKRNREIENVFSVNPRFRNVWLQF